MKEKAILIPDVLPNNLQAIRQMRGKSLKDVAKDLDINPVFLSAVEKHKHNLSGKLTIKMMQYFNVTFYQIYDIENPSITLPCTEKISEKVVIDVVLEKSLVDKLAILDETVKVIKDTLEKELLKMDIESDEKPEVKNYRLIKKKKTQDPKYYLCKLELEIIRKKIQQVEFDIDFFHNMDIELNKILVKRGFPEDPVTVKLDVNKVDIAKDKNKIILDKKYKIMKNGKKVLSDELYLKDAEDNNLKNIKDDNGNTIAISFTAYDEAINNIEFIVDYIKENREIDIDNIHEMLGLTYNGYINLVRGNQKISTKVMWRMVKLFKVQFELIMNVNKYAERFCI